MGACKHMVHSCSASVCSMVHSQAAKYPERRRDCGALAAAVRARVRWALLLLCVACSGVAAVPAPLLESDRVVMLGLKQAWGVAAWDTDRDVCGWWRGVYCVGGRVTEL